MITALTGDNSFTLQHELQQLVANFVAEHGDLALERIDGEDNEFQRLNEALTSLPFLAAKKLVVLRQPSANKQFVEQAEQLLANIPATTDVIIVEPKLDRRQSYYKLLKKVTDFREHAQLDPNGLAKWLTQQAHFQGGTLEITAARYLVERVGADQQLLANELDKLLLYNPKINRESIDLLTEATPQSTIFQLLEAAFAGDRQRTLELYQEQRALKIEAPQIIAMLSWQLHILALIKAAGSRSADAIASEAKLSPFVVRKSQGIARQLTVSDLKAHLSTLLDIDTRSKRVPLDLDEALQNYLLNLSNKIKP